MTYSYPPNAKNQPIQSIAVGASPFVWQNTNAFPVKVIISGGTLSAVDMSRDGVTYMTAGAGATLVPLNPGEYIRVTYVLIPSSMSVVPS